MKTRFLIIIGIIITSFAFPSSTFEKAYAVCAEEQVNHDWALKESELAFIGTVDRLENYDGPQRVTFIIHKVMKGEIDTPKYILENSRMVFSNDTVGSSSVDVDYTIGKSYRVYVMNGETDRCSTKEIFITDPIWEPGPESGKYTSENPVWINPCDDGYGLSDGVCITLEKMNKDNPICSQNPKHDFGKCNRVFEEPENTLDHVLAYCNATGPVTDEERTWWNATHYIDNIDCEFLDKFEYPSPRLIPEPENTVDDICGLGTILVDGKCAPDYSTDKVKIKTIGDDAPFFGIFVYIDNLFSWIMGK